MPISRRLDYVILDMIESSQKTIRAAPMNLGAIPGSGGGAGAPPGGFIGWLPQTRVAYDLSEVESLSTPGSGQSLLDNLNHIRARLGTLESGGSIFVVDENTSTTYNDVDTIHFSGGITVTNLGSGDIRVAVSGGSGHTIQDEGTPLTTRANLNFIGAGVEATDDAGNSATKITISTAADIFAASSLSSVDVGDFLAIVDISDGNALKKISKANFTTTLASTFLLNTGLSNWIQQGSTPIPGISGTWKLYFKSAGLFLIDGATSTEVGPLTANTGDISGTGVVGQVAEFVTNTKTLQAAKIIGPATNILTILNSAAKSVTFPGSSNDTVALLGATNVFTGQVQPTRGSEATNVFLGVAAGNATASGSGNVGLGQFALNGLTSGAGNVAFGDYALVGVTSGASNMGLGSLAAYSITTATGNVAIGSSALSLVTTGNDNIGIGAHAGTGVTTGASNTFIGAAAGFGAGANIAFATYIGAGAGTNAGGSYQTLVGNEMGHNSTPGQFTGSYNAGVGYGSFAEATTAHEDACLGFNTFIKLTSGSHNTAMGSLAAQRLTTGNYNTVIGWNAGQRLTDENYRLVIDPSWGGGYANKTDEQERSFIFGNMDYGGYIQFNNQHYVVNAPFEMFKIQALAYPGFTPTTGFGVGMPFWAETATANTYQPQALIASMWTTATNATRKAKLQLSAYDTAIRTGIEISANGTTPDITLLGDTWFVGAGFGLPYGSFYGNEITATYAVNNSYKIIADTDCVTGEVNLVTYTDAGTTLTISKAGKYKIDWSVSVEATSANIHILGGIMIDSTTVLQAAGKQHFETTIANRQMAMSGTAIISCPNGTEVIGVGVGSDANTTLTVDHVNLSIVQVGG